MTEPNVVTIYGRDVYPDLPTNARARSQVFDRLRSWCQDNRLRVFPRDGYSIVPPTRAKFERIWQQYVFQNPDDYIALPYPDTFSDIPEVLNSFDISFRYQHLRQDSGSTRYVINGGSSTSSRNHIYSFEVRNALILAACNITLYLKNMVMRNTQLFDKVDFVIPVHGYYNTGFVMDERNRDLPSGQPQYLKKMLYVHTDTYKELDDLLCRNVQDDFCLKIIHLIDHIALDMLSTIAQRRNIRRPNPNRSYQEVLDMIGRENMDLKQQIIHLMGEREMDEKTLSAVYNMILQAGLQSPTF